MFESPKSFPPTIVGVVMALVLAISATGCATQKPRVAHVKGMATEGHTYSTYALVRHPVNVGTIDPRMSDTIAEAMRKAGYEPTESAAADLHIQYAMLVSQNPRPSGPPMAVGLGQQGNLEQPFSDLLIASDSSFSDSRKVVVIMAGERATNRVVWVGVASDDVAAVNLEAAAIAAVQHVMVAFPPRDQWNAVVSTGQ